MGHVLVRRALIYLLLGYNPFNLAQVRAATMQINVPQDTFPPTGLGHRKSSLEILYRRIFVSLTCTSSGRLAIH